MGFVRSFVSAFTQKPKSMPIQKAAVKAAPKGPTAAEMEEERIKKASLANKRRGRKATMLTGSSGLQDETYLSKKTMLG